MALANTEIVHEGWLVKSPPAKRIWRAKWRRRWFVLKHSGELPGQYFLEYYTDRTCRKLKGKIDLDQCEQVDSGLTIESRKQRYAHMFDIRTPKRVYFLAADSESDMNNWVGCICHVCGLKVFYREEDEEPGSTLTLTRPPPSRSGMEDTPPVSPTSPTGSSGPYFPLSECVSGTRSLFFSEVMASINQPSSAPVTPAPTRGVSSVSLNMGTRSLRGKPRREDWDFFYDEPRQLGPVVGEAQAFEPKDAVRSFKKPESSVSGSASRPPQAPGERFVPPPRPPKPPHLSDHPSHNYLNLDQVNVPKTPSRSSSPRSPPSVSPPLNTPTADAWYDFPRSHQTNEHNENKDHLAGSKEVKRHCYSNAAPGEISAEIFTFNNNNTLAASSANNAIGSASSAAASSCGPQSVYSNLQSPLPLSSPGPSPLTPFTPPSVNRTLKPKKNTNITAAAGSVAAVDVVTPPPSVNRQLKPHRPAGAAAPPESHGSSSDDADEPSSRGSSRPNSAYEDDQGNQFLGGSRRLDEIQYLDLDLDTDSSLQSPKSPDRGQMHQASTTVYKTVDFLKTEAFNRTRLTVEECRNNKKAQ